MLTSAFVRSANSLLKFVEDSQVLIRLLTILNEASGDWLPALNQSIKGDGSAAKGGALLRQLLLELRGKLQECKPRLVFESIGLFRKILDSEVSLDDKGPLVRLSEKLWDFQVAYEGYIDDYAPESALVLVHVGSRLLNRLAGEVDGLRIASLNLVEQHEINEDLGELELQLSSSGEVSDFLGKIKSLSDIYEEVCVLLRISTVEFPLRIKKIESGSLFAWIFGNKTTISLIKRAVEAAALYFYRNKTAEGKISSLRMSGDAIEGLLDLRSRLKKDGLDSVEMDEQIKKSSAILARSLTNLLEGQQDVSINGKFLKINDDQVSPKQLEHRKDQQQGGADIQSANSEGDSLN